MPGRESVVRVPPRAALVADALPLGLLWGKQQGLPDGVSSDRKAQK